MVNGKKQRSRLVGSTICAAVTSVLMAQVSQAATWTGTAGDGLFATGTNWDTGTAPGTSGYTASTDLANFGRNALTGFSNTAVTVDANRNIQNITFNSTSGTSGAFYGYTLSGGPLLLTSGGTILAGSGAYTNSQTVSSTLVLEGDAGAYTIQSDIPGTSRLLTISGATSGVATGTNVTNLTLRGANTAANLYSGAISDGTVGGKVSVTKMDTGSWTLSGTNSFSGGVFANGGTLIANSATPATNLGSGVVTLNGGSLRLSASSSTFASSLAVGASGGGISVKAGAFNPTAITGTGTLSLGIDSGGTLTPNSFQGFGGTLNLNANSGSVTYRLGTSLTNFDPTSLQNASVNIGAGATLNRGFGTNGAQTVNIGSLAGVVGSTLTGGSSAGTGTFTYSTGGNNASTTFAGNITDGGTKTGLAKVGTGAMTLSGTNTYTGATNVSAGTLFVNGTNSGASPTTVALAGTLAGSGTDAGAIGDSGVIAPGATASSVGTLTLSGGTTFNDGSTFAVDYNAASSDMLSTTNLSLVGSDTLSLNALDATTSGIYTIATYTGTESGTFTNVPANATVDYGTGSNSVVTVTISAASVPEPTSIGLLGLAGAGMLRRRRTSKR